MEIEMMYIGKRTKNAFKNRKIFNFGKLSANEIEKVSYQSNVGKKTRDEINKIVSINNNTKKAIRQDHSLYDSIERLKNELILLNESQIKVTKEINNIIQYLDI